MKFDTEFKARNGNEAKTILDEQSGRAFHEIAACARRKHIQKKHIKQKREERCHHLFTHDLCLARAHVCGKSKHLVLRILMSIYVQKSTYYVDTVHTGSCHEGCEAILNNYDGEKT